MQISFTRSVRSGGFAACALGAALTVPAASALAAPAALNLRIEGKTATIYEGPVTSDGHVVEPATGERQRCDGTNGGANPQPGPTPTSTLDDGGMACEDLATADLNGEGKIDVIAAGRGTKNLKVYWNGG